jgi:hypothetical protein
MMTRKIVERAGRTDACSIRGEDPARAYRLKDDHRSAGGADMLRLCDDRGRIAERAANCSFFSRGTGKVEGRGLWSRLAPS